MKATFDHTEKLTPTITTFWFRPEKPMSFTAGQFTELTLPHDNADDRGNMRWFTLSSAPGGELVSITTRFAGADKTSSFKRALFALQPGAEVDMHEAMGDFVLPLDESTPLVWVAGGIGLTPMHSMAAWLAAQGKRRDIRMVLGVRTEEDAIFLDTFEQAGIKPIVIVGEPSDNWHGERGPLSAEVVLRLAKPADDALIYLSGPEPMLEALEKDFVDHGIAKSRLVTDFFPGYTSF